MGSQELEREQRATVGPLREELESNKKLLVQVMGEAGGGGGGGETPGASWGL